MRVGGRGETEMVTPKINFRNKIVNYKLINSLNSLKVKKSHFIINNPWYKLDFPRVFFIQKTLLTKNQKIGEHKTKCLKV